jgi:glycosyltransferase involved in cell wall biosynthesis
VRVLLVSHPALAPEIGAAQAAMNLAEALRARGHDARAWSPEPLPPETRWWNLWACQRRAIERFVAAEGPFDVIDTPAISATGELARAGRLVVRSIQPELLYLLAAVAGDLRRRPSPRALVHALLGCRRAAAIVAGWSRARAILCLGGQELAWMRRRFPFWGRKLGLYLHAPAAGERAGLAEVRRQRAATVVSRREGVRFLWIGRWAGHKGTSRLLRFIAARAVSHPEDTYTVAGCGPAVERDVPPAWLSQGRVRLLPEFSRAELPALLAAHDAGLFTSSVEGWGLSLNEMLEAGLPVYATQAGGVADLRPFFPGALRPFPPPVEGEVEPSPAQDLAANGYEARFNWAAIACAYERQALLAAEPPG